MSAITPAMFGRRISWASIFAGVIAATFMQLLLGSLGAALGATVVATGTNAIQEASAGFGAWLVLSTIVAMFVGGWVAGRLSGVPKKAEGMLHGFLTASLGTVFSLFLLASAIGGVFGAVTNLAGIGLQGTANNPAVAATGIPAAVDAVQGQVGDITPGQVQATADQAAEGTAAIGFGTFFILLLACGAAIAGGYVSAPRSPRMEGEPART